MNFEFKTVQGCHRWNTICVEVCSVLFQEKESTTDTG